MKDNLFKESVKFMTLRTRMKNSPLNDELDKHDNQKEKNDVLRTEKFEKIEEEDYEK